MWRGTDVDLEKQSNETNKTNDKEKKRKSNTFPRRTEDNSKCPSSYEPILHEPFSALLSQSQLLPREDSRDLVRGC